MIQKDVCKEICYLLEGAFEWNETPQGGSYWKVVHENIQKLSKGFVMSETTKGKSVPEALRMIAGWIEEGREIELSELNKNNWGSDEDGKRMAKTGCVYMNAYKYRAKPVKPRVAKSGFGYTTADGPKYMDCVELRDDVRSVLEREGLL